MAADDPQVNRVVVVTVETPQNVDERYLENLRAIRRRQEEIMESIFSIEFFFSVISSSLKKVGKVFLSKVCGQTN